MRVQFFQPVWLLLLVPLLLAWWTWRLPGRTLRWLRAVIFLLAVLAVARLAIRIPDHSGTVIVVADRSDSMPAESAAAQKELIDLLQKSRRPRDLLGVVAFGQRAIVEQAPQAGAFSGFNGVVGADHSDLNNALETALNLIPPDGGGRILVLSDGRWTGKDPVLAAARGAGRGVPIDYRLLSRPQSRDVAIQSFVGPDSVLPGQAYVLSGWVRAPADQEIRYELRRGDMVIAGGTRQVSAGLNRLMFRDRALQAGVSAYQFVIRGPEEDPVPENNAARALVSVEGARPAVIVSAAGGDSGLVQLLRRGGVEVRGVAPGEMGWALEELASCSAVVLENVPAGKIGVPALELLAAWVTNSGSGLLLTGGQKSYGPGGYFKSPLDSILPVSMEMRREHRKLSLAIVVVLDRSGSMAMPAGGGQVKMDLANLGTVQVLDLLSPLDEFGVIAVDSSPHTIVPLGDVEASRWKRGQILAIDSMGGGIFIYEALRAAAGMVNAAKAQTRHIILFADAADSEEPGDYRNLIDKCREAGVTISVVGLGTEADSDANLLKDIAARGGGTCYFSADAQEIPRLFAQDTFTVARSTFVDEETPFEFTAGYSLFGALPAGTAPALGGYNLCYLRPDATLAAVTLDEYKAPIVSGWNAGSGRVLCFAGEADGKFSGPLPAWNQAGEFYATLVRWVAGRPSPLPPEVSLVQVVRDGACFVQLHLDPDRKSDPFTAMPSVKVLHGLAGTAPERETLVMQWRSADLLETSLPMTGRETVLNTVEIPGQPPATLPPVCLPYSPEFVPEQAGRGGAVLARIAHTTGGKDRVEVSQTWSELAAHPRYVELSPWLFAMALSLFVLEVLERRTGWLTRRFRRTQQQQPVEAAEPSAVPEPAVSSPAPWARLLRRRKERGAAVGEPAAPQPMPAGEPAAGRTALEVSSPATSETSALDALRKARERAGRRTGGKP